MGKESRFSLRKRKEVKISEESATEVVLDLCERFDIDIDAIDDPKSKKNTENLLNALVDYVSRGILEFNTDGTIVHNLQNAPGEVVKINYKRITGEQKLAMDGYGENENYARMYAVLGAASGLGESAIKKLSGIDLKVAEALTLFFL